MGEMGLTCIQYQVQNSRLVGSYCSVLCDDRGRDGGVAGGTRGRIYVNMILIHFVGTAETNTTL